MNLVAPIALGCAVALSLAGCSRQPSPNAVAVAPTGMPAPAATSAPAPAPAADRLLGRWTGVEGMYLVVGKGDAPGRYTLEMQWDLDHKGSFAGTAQGDTIGFDRAGRRETLRPTAGAATGLKYLAEKTECLTVRDGEGYCRA